MRTLLLALAILVIPACSREERHEAPAVPEPLYVTPGGYRYHYAPTAADWALSHEDVAASIDARVDEWVATHPEHSPEGLRALARSYPIVIFNDTVVPGAGDTAV
ncbi:MAG TPA: hypothetical protein VEJ18_10545, partial [Planctomycetota bacterium]|nr:hypothetical protein [Planctomycetota bacterium]